MARTHGRPSHAAVVHQQPISIDATTAATPSNAIAIWKYYTANLRRSCVSQHSSTGFICSVDIRNDIQLRSSHATRLQQQTNGD
jgi:hypothetical protein